MGQPGKVERLSMKQRLLIADRDAELCELYRTFLAAMGCDAEPASMDPSNPNRVPRYPRRLAD